MPPIKAIEALAELAASAGSKILPSRLKEVFESLAGKEGRAEISAQLERASGSAAPERDLLGNLSITDKASRISSLSPERAAITKSNEALVGHVTDLMPQVQNGKLDWILGGSSGVNALATSRRVSILDPTKLPSIVPTRTIDLPDAAIGSYENFVRKVGDFDAFVVNGGKNQFLQSPYIGSMEVGLPEAAKGALKAVGEARTSPLVQGVKMEFDNPEIAAIQYAGKTVYITGPGQLVGNKLRQVLLQYAPADAQKTTGDFAHLLDAASKIYTEQELVNFGSKAINRNSLLYGREVSVPWDRSEANTKFLGFLRKVVEADEKNGVFMRGLKIEPTESITAIRLLEKHPVPADKQAIANFINRHGDFVSSLDVKGSPERAMFLQQGGAGKARQSFLDMLDRLPSGTDKSGTSLLQQRIQAIDTQLEQTKNLPELTKIAKKTTG